MVINVVNEIIKVKKESKRMVGAGGVCFLWVSFCEEAVLGGS